MPTFLNKILGVFSNSGSESSDFGIDFGEVNRVDFNSAYSILTKPEEAEWHRFVFVGMNTQPGVQHGHFAVFLSESAQPTKYYRVFSNPNMDVAMETAQTIYKQLEPFIEITSSNNKSRPFFNSSSNVKEYIVQVLQHPGWNSAHVMASMPNMKFVDPKALYPKAAIHHKLNIACSESGLTPLMIALDCHNQGFIAEAVSPTGLMRDVINFDARDICHRNYIYYAVTYHVSVMPTTDPEKDKDGVLYKVASSYPEGCREVDSEGRSPLHLAVAAKRLDILKFLTKCFPNALEHNPNAAASLLHVAAEVGQLEIVQFLLERAPELVLLKDMKYNGTALHWATNVEVVDALLDAGCNPDEISSSGESVVHVAIRYDRIAVAQTLIAFGAQFDAVAPNQGTPLHMVSRLLKPSKVLAEWLIAYDCDVDILDSNGHSARHLAAVASQLPPEPDQSDTPVPVRLTNAIVSILSRDDEMKRKRDECNNIVALLDVVGAKRCPPGRIGCVPGCAAGGTCNGVMPTGFPSFPIVDQWQTECPAIGMVDRMISEAAASDLAANPEKYKDRLRVLSLDGGGCRGLMTTMILRHLERKVGLPIDECFDFIAGTSVGGLIALFVTYGKPYGPVFAPCGYNRLVNMQRLAYHMRKKVFVGSRPYSTNALESLLKKAYGEDTLMSSCSSPKVMVTTVKANLFPAELVLFRNYSSATDLVEEVHPELAVSKKPKIEDQEPKKSEQTVTGKQTESPTTMSALMAAVAEAEARPTSPPPFISVTSGSSGVFQVNSPTRSNGAASPSNMGSPSAPSRSNYFSEGDVVWRAARATGAAPTYFRPFGQFIDGGVMANNPALDAMTDLHQLEVVATSLGFGEETAEKYRAALVVSVGTGREMQRETPVADIRRPEGVMDGVGLYKQVIAFINLLIDQATIADGRPVDRIRAWCSQVGAHYVRLTPLFSHHVELDEHDENNLVRALFETRAYLHANLDQVTQLTTILRLMAETRKKN